MKTDSKWFEVMPHPFFEPTWRVPTSYDGWNIKSNDLYFEPVWYAPNTGLKVGGKLTSEGLKIFEKEIETNMEKKYTPKKIIVNGPATIVMWDDGTKTVVKCEDAHPYANTYDAFNAALAKKIFGTNSHLKKVIDRATERQIPKTKVDAKEVKNDGESN